MTSSRRLVLLPVGFTLAVGPVVVPHAVVELVAEFLVAAGGAAVLFHGVEVEYLVEDGFFALFALCPQVYLAGVYGGVDHPGVAEAEAAFSGDFGDEAGGDFVAAGDLVAAEADGDVVTDALT